MKAFSTWFKLNWKTNLLAIVAIVYSAQAFMTSIMAWENGQPTNWRAAIISLIVAGVGFVAKDASTHSTVAQTQAATAVVTNNPQAPLLVKEADAQVAAKK